MWYNINEQNESDYTSRKRIKVLMLAAFGILLYHDLSTFD